MSDIRSPDSPGTIEHADAAIDEPVDAETAEPVERAEIGKPFVRPTRLVVLLGLLTLLGVWRGLPILIVVGSIIAMIFFHELGHYMAARRAGMRVTEFFIGFGPRIWSFRRGDVEYGIKAIPAGAYVKIIGMSSLDEVPEEDETSTYRQKTYGQRMLVAVAGSGMHFIMATILLYVAFMAVGGHDATHWVVDKPLPGSAAERAGIEHGDTIVSVAGVSVSTQPEMGAQARKHPGETVEIGIVRDGMRRSVPATLNSRINVYGTVGEDLALFSPGRGQILVSGTAKTGVLAASGIREDDHITAVNGAPVATLADVRAAVARAKSGTLELGVTRAVDGTSRSMTTKVALGNAVASSEEQGFLGVGQELVAQRVGPVAAVPKALGMFGHIASASVTGLGHFFTPSSIGAFFDRTVHTAPGETHTSATPQSATATAQAGDARNSNRMTSIVGAVVIGEQITAGSWGDFLVFLASLNIVIGIFNLIPLPPFDGGHVAIATYEKVREMFRRDGKRYFADFNKLLPVAYAVVLLLVLVGTMAIYLDLADPVKI